MPKISRYNHETHRLEWLEASDEEHAAWKAARAAKAAGPGARPSGARSHKRRQSAATTETLDGPETATDAIREAAKASGAKGRKPSPGTGPLTPVVTLFSRLGGIVLIRGSYALTGGKHAMTPAEAISIAAPAVRILNKELGKRIKYTPKVGGEYAAEIERIGTGAASWILRGLSKAFGIQLVEADGYTVRQPPQAQSASAPAQPAPFFEGGASDNSAAEMAADDTADLFAGSEPVPQSGATGAGSRSPDSLSPFGPGVTSANRPAAPHGPPGALLGVPDSVWNSVSPPEMGAAEVMG